MSVQGTLNAALSFGSQSLTSSVLPFSRRFTVEVDPPMTSASFSIDQSRDFRSSLILFLNGIAFFTRSVDGLCLRIMGSMLRVNSRRRQSNHTIRLDKLPNLGKIAAMHEPDNRHIPAKALPLSLDLEQYRQKHGLTYRELARRFGFRSISQVRRCALGQEMLRDEQLERVLQAAGGEVDLYALHRRRMEWLATRPAPSRPRVARIEIGELPASGA